jgi:hypothetical protein
VGEARLTEEENVEIASPDELVVHCPYLPLHIQVFAILLGLDVGAASYSHVRRVPLEQQLMCLARFAVQDQDGPVVVLLPGEDLGRAIHQRHVAAELIVCDVDSGVSPRHRQRAAELGDRHLALGGGQRERVANGVSVSEFDLVGKEERASGAPNGCYADVLIGAVDPYRGLDVRGSLEVSPRHLPKLGLKLELRIFLARDGSILGDGLFLVRDGGVFDRNGGLTAA